MLPFEDIAVHRADLPPISSKHTELWVPGLLRTVGAAWIVVDLADPACAKRALVIGTELAQRKIKLSDRWSGVGAGHRVQPASHSPATDAPAPEEVLDPSPGPAPHTPRGQQQRSRSRA